MFERADEINSRHSAAIERAAARRTNLPLVDVLYGVLTDDRGGDACVLCHKSADTDPSGPKLTPAVPIE